jgi:GrpB-like predicted nucleotidyltransferase (UPF0157 family)
VSTISVVDYDPSWPRAFAELRARLRGAVGELALAVEHVGSTAVPGLAAKPIIDITIVVASAAQMPLVIAKLGELGYRHQGDLGIEGREAFASPGEGVAHHLYACVRGNLALENHLAVRDYLRGHPETVAEYGALKKRLAAQHGGDRAAYEDGKTDFVLEILRRAGFPQAKLAAIARANPRAL